MVFRNSAGAKTFSEDGKYKKIIEKSEFISQQQPFLTTESFYAAIIFSYSLEDFFRWQLSLNFNYYHEKNPLKERFRVIITYRRPTICRREWSPDK